MTDYHSGFARFIRTGVVVSPRFIAALWLCCFALPLSAADKLTVGTLNCNFLVRTRLHVKYDVPLFESEWSPEQAKLWKDPDYRNARFEESLEAIARVVHRLNADILVLEEVGNKGEIFELQKAVADLGLKYEFAAVGNQGDTYTQQCMAVLSKREIKNLLTEIPGRESYDRELDDVESEEDTGLTKGLRFEVDFNGQPLTIYGVHLSSERGGHESDAKRIAQASIVRRHYLPRLNEGALLMVVGDLNDHRGQPTLRRIRGRDDLWGDLIQTGGPTFTRRRSGEPLDDYNARIRGHYTFEWVGKRQQIDHILISRSLRDACSRVTPKFGDVTERIGDTTLPATDHRTMLLTLEGDE